jgi:hypothetical protein
MLPLILLSLVSIAVVIVLYQLVIQKYYWGPQGPPKKQDRNKDQRQK